MSGTNCWCLRGISPSGHWAAVDPWLGTERREEQAASESGRNCRLQVDGGTGVAKDRLLAKNVRMPNTATARMRRSCGRTRKQTCG